MIGIITNTVKTADTAFTANIVPATVGLSTSIAANQTKKCRWWVPVTVGAAGGVRAIIAVPAGGTLFNATIKLFNTVAPSLTTAAQAASAAFTNALADAGTHWLEIEATIVNGATAGNIDLQMAQNTSDATPLTVLRGGSLQAIAQ